MRHPGITIGVAALAASALAGTAHAFCGFYVSGSGEKMFNDATQVVLMRQGTRTVLSMQNDYKGPLEDFAMVVPVPVVLHEPDVKTLPRTVFEHTEALGSPRLVEYWEQDPCPMPVKGEFDDRMRAAGAGAPAPSADMAAREEKQSVRIEARFDVGEYEILILSATDSAGLETWLRQNHYRIPPGAEPLLRPYVEGGSKFFVAKVDPKKVAMQDGHAALSPLRFHYDSEDFALPIRLGMANSSGKQDLIVNVISADKRYEVANYKNVFIPTNFDVKPAVKTRFAEFYAALFDKTVEANPGAVVTEYAWTAVPNYHCDPCTDADISNPDLMTLGGDVVGGAVARGQFVLTRLHARYGRTDMKDDLRFREARPVTGGREMWSKNGIEYGAVPSPQNYFQARYAIRHAWTGPIKCQNPVRNVWGGPPDGNYQPTIAANKLAFAPRGQLEIASVVKRDLWEIGLKRGSAPGGGKFATPPIKKLQGLGLAGLLGALAVLLVFWRRRRGS
ncbi:MAG: DUF2330 domain-containing protein [Deltaproteobacteria bacterium]|nr:MAG: DUF2330 domain-containing protein [Deltaproteobacteria bacterium]